MASAQRGQDLELGESAAPRFWVGDKDTLHPRLAHMAIEEGSWSDDDEVQRMWAGLLVSGTSVDGRSEENLVFMNLLRQMSCLQTRVIKFACEKATKYALEHELALADELTIKTESLMETFGEPDIHRLDRELDHLRSMGLISGVWGGGGIDLSGGETVLTPSALGLNLYVRAQGSKLHPTQFWQLQKRGSQEEQDNSSLQLAADLPPSGRSDDRS